MGLDTFVDTNDEKILNEFNNANLKLCGGLFSSNGQGSFRGKVYDDIVQDITGVTLYREQIGVDTLYVMRNKMVEFQNKTPKREFYKYLRDHFITKREYDDLIIFFTICIRNNVGIVAWF